MTENEFIREKIGMGEILAQLAEEATELAKAALKYRRAITATNPTPVTPEEALEALREEIADVDLCLVVAGDLCEASDNEIFRMETKRARWIERIKAAETYTKIIGSPFTKPHDNGDGTFVVIKKPEFCCGRCTGPGGYVCPHLLPDFGCDYDVDDPIGEKSDAIEKGAQK